MLGPATDLGAEPVTVTACGAIPRPAYMQTAPGVGLGVPLRNACGESACLLRPSVEARQTARCDHNMSTCQRCRQRCRHANVNASGQPVCRPPAAGRPSCFHMPNFSRLPRQPKVLVNPAPAALTRRTVRLEGLLHMHGCAHLWRDADDSSPVHPCARDLVQFDACPYCLCGHAVDMSGMNDMEKRWLHIAHILGDCPLSGPSRALLRHELCAVSEMAGIDRCRVDAMFAEPRCADACGTTAPARALITFLLDPPALCACAASMFVQSQLVRLASAFLRHYPSIDAFGQILLGAALEVQRSMPN